MAFLAGGPPAESAARSVGAVDSAVLAVSCGRVDLADDRAAICSGGGVRPGGGGEDGACLSSG